MPALPSPAFKYRPEYLEKSFDSLATAREWVDRFVDWYNHEHRHSSIKYVTPVEHHTGQDKAILTNRKVVYLKAKMAHPERWSGDIRSWDLITEVYLDRSKTKKIWQKIRWRKYKL